MSQVRTARAPAGRGDRRFVRHRRGDRARSSARRASRSPWARAGPSAARRSPRRSARPAARPSRTRSTWPTTSPVAVRRRRRPPTSVTSRWSSATPAVAPGVVHEIDTERFAREIDVNLVGAHRLVRAFVPAMVERRRGDVVFVSSDVAVRPRPFMAAYAAGKWGLEGMAQSHADGARGHRRPRQHRAARARPGARWAPTGTTSDAADVLEPLGALRPRPAPALPQARGVADAITPSSRAPRGVHLNLVEVTPEAPVEDRMTTTLIDGAARSRGSPTTRTATCRSCAPTRSGCCTGCATSAATSAASGSPTGTS